MWAGVRLLAISNDRLRRDPSLELWLFVILSQIQVLFALIGGASPAMRKTLLVFVTNYGTVSDSQNMSRPRYRASYAMTDLTSRKRSLGRSDNPAIFPYAGSGGKHIVSAGKSDQNRGDPVGDGESQEGIVRQDDFEITYTNADEHESMRQGCGSL